MDVRAEWNELQQNWIQQAMAEGQDLQKNIMNSRALLRLAWVETNVDSKRRRTRDP